MKKYNKSIGFYGENIAKSILENNNHKIIETNFQTRSGEIDIISIYTNILVFTEVKTRFNSNFGLPCESISKSKIKNIIKLANYYIHINNYNNFFIRFDVIEILLSPNSTQHKSNYIPDAFRAN
ncbi:YraN family protein [uncultured Clostridium sp.]|uniref:YraN family protein n=1 Tax=uncultured Clostridium sp. TaxID=59620 RepID=UPI002635E1C1|nr:YraN family protein [uncultured Clostridium sp.]